MIQYHILQTNIKRTVWQRVRRITNEILRVKGLSFRQTYILLKVKHCSIWQHKLLPFEIPSIQCIPFLVIKFTSIVTLIMAQNDLKFLKILLPVVIKIGENTVLVFQYILRFWNQTIIVIFDYISQMFSCD